MVSNLARRLKLDVSSDGVTWLPFLGIHDFAVKENSTIQDVTDFDTNGFVSKEKTITGAVLTVKARRPITAGAWSPGQELVRTAGQFQFGSAVRLYVRWYDRNNQPEAFTAYAIVQWSVSKSSVADVEELTATFDTDGTISSIANPAGSPQVPVITAFSPTSGAGTGQMLRITGAYFTGVTAAQVKSAAVAMTSIDVISDSVIEAILPSQAAGTYAITVTNGAGVSTGVNYTRGA